jgi:hypothetical protein
MLRAMASRNDKLACTDCHPHTPSPLGEREYEGEEQPKTKLLVSKRLAVNHQLLYALGMQKLLRHVPPRKIIQLRRSSEKLRKQIIKNYLLAGIAGVTKAAPPYLKGSDIISSHIKRSVLELKDGGCAQGSKDYHNVVRASIGDYALKAEGASLTEVCMGTIAGVLKVKANLQVAAGFFSTMIATVDDYIDKEGSYATLGKGLLMISHAYRDLMDVSLEAELRKGTITTQELYEIKLALFEVIKTLVSSEDIVETSTESATEYLYRKSCGDKVVDVLMPASRADGETKRLCRDIGRLTGEAGQLIDDVMDYSEDLSLGKRNFIIMSASTPADIIVIAQAKIHAARVLTEKLPAHDDGKDNKDAESLTWILATLDEVTGILAARLALKKDTSPRALNLSASLVALLGRAIPTNTFLLWF